MFLPNNIDFTQSNIYILSIRLATNGFYFSIHCPTDSSIFYQKSTVFGSSDNYLKNIEKLIFDYSFFTHNYLRINVIQLSERLTLVPDEFYNKKLESKLLSYNFHHPIKKTMSDDVSYLNCKLIWEIDESHHSFLSRSLLNPIFKNHLSILTSFFYRLHNKSETALFVNFNDNDMMDIIAFSNENLIFAKTFVARERLENSYFLQKTWEALTMDAKTDALFFMGKTEQHSASIETHKKLISSAKELSIELPDGVKIKQSDIPTEILSLLCV